MTCFWDGILKSLNISDFKYKFNIDKKLNKVQFINFLKKNNKFTKDIIWNNKKLSEKELKENYEAVKNYNIKKINNGHLCSTCDYFLLLICDLFKINIIHFYNKHKIVYKNNTKSRKTITFHSNKRHFWN